MLWGVTLILVASSISNLAQPYSIQYEHFTGIYYITLPWGEHITRGHRQPGILTYGISIIVISIIIYDSSLAAISYWRHKRQNDLLLLISFSILVFNAAEGILSQIGIIRDFEMGPFGFLLMVIIMGIARSSKSKLKDSEMRFRTLFELAPMGISLSRDGVTIDANDALLKMYGFESIEEIRGTPLINRIAEPYRDDLKDRVHRRINNIESEPHYETVGLRKDGNEFPLLISARRLTMKDGPISIAYLMDFTERRTNEQKIKQLAYYDQLTFLPNRQLLDTKLLRQSDSVVLGKYLSIVTNNTRDVGSRQLNDNEETEIKK